MSRILVKKLSCLSAAPTIMCRHFEIGQINVRVHGSTRSSTPVSFVPDALNLYQPTFSILKSIAKYISILIDLLKTVTKKELKCKNIIYVLNNNGILVSTICINSTFLEKSEVLSLSFFFICDFVAFASALFCILFLLRKSGSARRARVRWRTHTRWRVHHTRTRARAR